MLRDYLFAMKHQMGYPRGPQGLKAKPNNACKKVYSDLKSNIILLSYPHQFNSLK